MGDDKTGPEQSASGKQQSASGKQQSETNGKQQSETNGKQQSETSDPRTSPTELYEQMSGIFREKLERAGSISEEAFERAIKETREWAEKLRDTYGDDVTRVGDYIRRDWHDAIRFTREQTRKSFDLDRLQVGVLDVLFMLAKTAGSQLESFANRINERLTYKTGEITGAGTLECTQCHQHLSFDKATRIPPCPKCHNTQYRRSF